MPDSFSPSPARRSVSPAGTPGEALRVVQAALVAIVVLYFGRELLIPLVLSVLLAFVLAPVVRALRRLKVPRVGAVLIAVFVAVGMILTVALGLVQQVTQLAADLPLYRASIQTKLEGLQSEGSIFDRLGAQLRELTRDLRLGAERAETTAAPGPTAAPTPPPEAPRPIPVEVRPPPQEPLELVGQVLEPLLYPLALTGIVIVLVVFILLYREDLRDRLIRLAGAHDLQRTVAAMDDAVYRLSRFFLTLVALNAAYGAVMAVVLWLLGIPQPALWGAVAGLMRFVPFVGSFVAVAFPILLALAVDPGWTTVLWVAGIYLVGELAMGQVFEPLLFGSSTGLSPVAVIAAATFWTWLWGPLGLLLAVPMTVCLVVLGRHVPQLEFLDVMLGDRPPLQPAETFYQRALADNADELAELAADQLREMPLSAWYDEVALPGLALAQADAARNALGPERTEVVRRQVEVLLEDLEDEEDEPQAPAAPPGEPAAEAAPAAAAPLVLDPAWREPGAVLCISGRGRLDGLGAAMLAQILGQRGLGALVEPHEILRSTNLDRVETERVRAACLCMLPGGSSVISARYFLRRLRRRLPDAVLVACVWGAPGDSPTIRELRQDTDAIFLSLRDAVSGLLRGAQGERVENGAAPPPSPATVHVE